MVDSSTSKWISCIANPDCLPHGFGIVLSKYLQLNGRYVIPSCSLYFVSFGGVHFTVSTLVRDTRHMPYGALFGLVVHQWYGHENQPFSLVMMVKGMLHLSLLTI